VPWAGNPDNTTLPVDTIHVGCIIIPTKGAEGFTTVNENTADAGVHAGLRGLLVVTVMITVLPPSAAAGV
jgi:hypothetical protein